MVGLYQRSYLRAFMTSVTAPPSYWHLYVPMVASIHNNLAPTTSSSASPDLLFRLFWTLLLKRFVVRQGIAGWSFPHFYELEPLSFFWQGPRFPRQHSTDFQGQFRVDDFVLIANRVKARSLAPRWSSIGRITKVCSPCDLRGSRHSSWLNDRISMLRPANNLCFNMELSDWECVFYSVQHFAYFRVWRMWEWTQMSHSFSPLQAWFWMGFC